MRVLVFGKTGQVAQELAYLMRPAGITAEFLGREQADLSDPLACAALIAASRADIVINAAAYTAVDRAEAEPDIAHMVNTAAPAAMATAAARRGLPFLHISTDYVFDGQKAVAWVEDASPAPQGIYGQTKLDGEIGVIAAGGEYVILRTAWVFSAHGANFVKTMHRLGAARDELNVVNDQFGGPTPARDIAAALIAIAQEFVAGRGVSGIFHFSGRPAVSWAEFAEQIFKGGVNAPKINPIPTTAYPTAAKRPANSVLDCSKIFETYGITQPDWHKGLRAVLANLEKNE